MAKREDEDISDYEVDINCYLYNTRTGSRILNLPFFDGGWTQSRNTAEEIKVKIPVYDPAVAALDLNNAATAGQASLAIEENERFMGAGPVWDPVYDRDNELFDLGGSGVWNYFKKRTIQKVAALTQAMIDPTTGKPTPATTSTWSGLSLGTIMKRALQQSMLMPGGNIPLVFQPDEAGIHTRTVNASDLKYIDSFLQQATEVENGPEARFVAEWNANQDGIQQRFITGTNARPELYSDTIHEWNLSAGAPGVRGFKTKTGLDNLASLAWLTGGRQGDNVITAVSLNRLLIDADFPLFEATQTRSTVVLQSTLQSYANEMTRYGTSISQNWEFEVRSDRTPMVGEYNVGDFCNVTIEGDPIIPNGTYTRRIVSISRESFLTPWIKLQTEGVFVYGR